MQEGSAGNGLRWGIEKRLQFIEFRLFWEGHVNRQDLTEAFGVSVNQASSDINRYLDMAPGNSGYDRSARTYLRTASFKPRFLHPDPNLYLNQLRSLADGIVEHVDVWLGHVPRHDMVPAPARGIDSKVLRAIVAAIRRKEKLQVRYQSLSRPEPSWRWITPHALAFDGFRWHARGWCGLDEIFKDFVIARMLDTRKGQPAEMVSEDDQDWHAYATLEIGPHPELSETQKKVIALDYGMKDGRAEIPVRRAFLYYTLKRLGLDEEAPARAPQDQQIVLLNPQILGHERMSA
ncbi:MAG: WYL domain-containing protein [Pseudomonadota bacterium]